MQATLEKILFGLIGIIVAGIGIYIFNGTHSWLLRGGLLLALFVAIGYLLSRAPGGHNDRPGKAAKGLHKSLSPFAWGVIILLGLAVLFIVGNIILVFITGYGDF